MSSKWRRGIHKPEFIANEIVKHRDGFCRIIKPKFKNPPPSLVLSYEVRFLDTNTLSCFVPEDRLEPLDIFMSIIL